MTDFIEQNSSGKIRFQCQFCHSLLETALAYCSPLDCPSCGRQTFVPKSPFSPGCVIGDFAIQEKIGQGAVGTVYKAFQLSLEREVALKVLLPELTNLKIATDFLREARATAKLIHVNLVLAYAVGEENGVFFMAMHYIKGETLKAKLLREGRIGVDEALHIVQQVAEALHYAWQEAEMIHRDVKPDNIMITCDGIVKLADLGLAINQSEWSKDMDVSGTPSYMSPEQFAGEKLDQRCDIYSLGITLYQMLSGDTPFQAETVKSMAKQHYTETAVPLHRIGLGISLSVSSLVKRMMEKLPEDRFSDTEALIKAIWLVRQSTAQNKHLVPAMHTCSISQLKYQHQPVQNQEKDQKIKAKPSQTQTQVLSENSGKLKKHRDWLFWSMVAIFPIPFIILIASALFHPSTKEPSETVFLEGRVAQLEGKLTSPDMLPAALAVEASGLLAQFPAQRTHKQEDIFWKLKCCIANLDAAEKAIELVSKADYVKSLEVQLKELLTTKNVNNNKLVVEIKKNKIAESTIADLNSKIKELEDKIIKQKSCLVATILKQQVVYEKYWKDDLLNDLYKQLSSGEYARTEAFLTYKRSLRGQEHRAWFNSYIEWVKHLQELEDYFDTGNSHFVSKSVEGRKITMISSGNVYFEDKDGTVKSCKWYEFPAQGVYELLRKAEPELAGKRNVFDADIACLKGNIFSPEVMQGRPCLKELCQAVIDSQVESILVIAVYDKPKATIAADSLLNMLRNTEFVCAVKARLGTLIYQKPS